MFCLLEAADDFLLKWLANGGRPQMKMQENMTRTDLTNNNPNGTNVAYPSLFVVVVEQLYI